MTETTCVRCGVPGEVVISTIEVDRPVSRRYCDACWRIARYEAGPIMSEGPAVWGQDWSEMEEWLARGLRSVEKRPYADLWRRLLAHDLRQQLSHLPDDVPPQVAAFLRRVDDGAGE